MIGTLTTNVELIWDLTRERPTLGGALVLRQEGEIIARLNNADSLNLHLLCPDRDIIAADQLTAAVFATSAFPFHMKHSSTATDGWPSAAVRATQDFSYFSFSRLLALHAENGRAPRLHWNQRLHVLAERMRARFPGRLVCVHLRSVAPFTAEESNADGPTWDAFFAKHAHADTLDFLLLGDDRLPGGLTLRSGVSSATNLGLDLATQLALVGCADGFLGMASGICTAANLSNTPHVIFKHPAHHPAEMQRELGDTDRFPFAESNQRLWRRAVTPNSLDEAFALISS